MALSSATMTQSATTTATQSATMTAAPNSPLMVAATEAFTAVVAPSMVAVAPSTAAAEPPATARNTAAAPSMAAAPSKAGAAPSKAAAALSPTPEMVAVCLLLRQRRLLFWRRHLQRQWRRCFYGWNDFKWPTTMMIMMINECRQKGRF